MSKRRVVQMQWLSRVGYEAAWEEQKRLSAEVAVGATMQQLMLLEHPPTFTFGRKGQASNLLFDEAKLAQEGINTHWVDRGGDVTYHGPGQLVGYPILNLYQLYNQETLDLHRYLRDLEQTVINVLAQLGIVGWRYPGYTGVWVDQVANGASQPTPHKIAAIGVKVSGAGVTSHGFALNVSPNMSHFDGIIPCGITEHAVTSVASLTGRQLPLEDVVPLYKTAFENQFQLSAETNPIHT